MFQIELSDPAEAKAIISNKITCPQTGIIFKVEEFRAPISAQLCYNCQNFGHLAKKGIPSTCGGQPKKLCLHFKAKLGPTSTTQG